MAEQRKAVGCWARGDPMAPLGVGWPRCSPGPHTELSAGVRSGTGMVPCGDALPEAPGECDPTARSHHSCEDSEQQYGHSVL